MGQQAINERSWRVQGIFYALLGAVLFSAKSIVIKFIYLYEPSQVRSKLI